MTIADIYLACDNIVEIFARNIRVYRDAADYHADNTPIYHGSYVQLDIELKTEPVFSFNLYPDGSVKFLLVRKGA